MSVVQNDQDIRSIPDFLGYVDFEHCSLLYLKRKYGDIAEVAVADSKTGYERKVNEILWYCNMNFGQRQHCCFDTKCPKLDGCLRNNISHIQDIVRNEHLNKMNLKLTTGKKKQGVFQYGSCCSLTLPEFIRDTIFKAQRAFASSKRETFASSKRETFASSNSNKRFVIIKLGIRLQYTNKNDSLNHANILLIDLETQTMERFDPFGPQSYSIKQIYQDVMNKERSHKSRNQQLNLFREKLKLMYFHYFHYTLNNALAEMASWFSLRFQNPNMTSPYFGCQYFQEQETKFKQMYQGLNKGLKASDKIGFCSAWVIWYIEMRLSWPHQDPVKMIQDFCMEHYNELTRFIQYYSLKLHAFRP